MLQNDEWIDHWSNFLLTYNQGCKFLAAKNRKIRDPIAQKSPDSWRIRGRNYSNTK